MKSYLFAAVALLTLSNVASAADVVTEAPTVYNWSGAYVGLHAGYAWGRTEYSDGDDVIFGEVPELRDNPEGFLGGIQAGYNWQNGAIVYGIEGDLSFGNVDGHRLLLTSSGDAEFDEEMRMLGTVRARVGYAFDNVLPYITGGFAAGNFKLEGAGSGDTTTNVGWTIGTGVEVGLTEKLSLKAEYLYADLGKEDFRITNSPAGSPKSAAFDAEIHTARIGLNYRF